MKGHLFWLLLLVVVTGTPAAERAPDAGPGEAGFTLDQAIARAREVSAKLAALDSDVVAADAWIRENRAAFKPQVTLSAGYDRRSNVPELDFVFPDGSTRTIFPNIPNNWATGVGFDVPIYTGGRETARVDAATADRNVVDRQRVTAESDLVLDVTRAYWSLVTARENTRVLAESLDAYESHLVDARNRQRVGLAASNEVLAVEVARDRAELARIRAENHAAQASADLARLLDLSGDTPIVTLDTLQPTEPPSLDLDQLVPEALAARPELAELAFRAEAAQSRATAERAERRPHVAVSAAWDYQNPNRNIVPWETTWQDTWNVGIGVRFVAFDGGRAAAAGARADANALGLRRRYDDMERSIRFEVTSRVLDVRNAEASIPVAERAVDSARENLRVTRDRYREGVTPSSDLLDAEVDLLRAGLDHAEALAQLRLALAGLDRAVGR